MDELAKTEARNYLSAAGFFLLAAHLILVIFSNIGTSTFAEPSNYLHLALGIGLIVIAILLIVLRKRDMIAILFFTMGFFQIFYAFSQPVIWDLVLAGLLVLVALITLTSKEKVKWLLFLIPAIWFVGRLIVECIGYNVDVATIIFFTILALISLYYAFCCACERCSLPGSRLLTADEQTDFNASGSVLGYILFAIISGGFALYYIFGATILPFASLMTIQFITGSLLIFVAVLLLAVGKMRFTPIMFLLIGLTAILNIFASGMMYIGIGILFLIIGLFSILRKESRILPGIMLILVSIVIFIHDAGGIHEISILATVLECIVAAIAIYIAFAVYSQRNLPKF